MTDNKPKLPFRYRLAAYADVVSAWAFIGLVLFLFAWTILAALDKMGTF